MSIETDRKIAEMMKWKTPGGYNIIDRGPGDWPELETSLPRPPFTPSTNIGQAFDYVVAWMRDEGWEFAFCWEPGRWVEAKFRRP